MKTYLLMLFLLNYSLLCSDSTEIIQYFKEHTAFSGDDEVKRDFLKINLNTQNEKEPISLDGLMTLNKNNIDPKKQFMDDKPVRFKAIGTIEKNTFISNEHKLNINDHYLKYKVSQLQFNNNQVEIDGYVCNYKNTTKLTLVYIHHLKLLKTNPSKLASKKLFDGNTLNGWKQPTFEGNHVYNGSYWSVDSEEKTLIGRRLKNDKRGGWLWTYSKYSDFELSLKVFPDWGCDTGILLRQNEQGAGIQVCIDYRNGGSIGFLHGQGTGSYYTRPFSFERTMKDGKLSELKVIDHYDATVKDGLVYACSSEEFIKAWKQDDFNEIKVRCKGEDANITIWVNGLKTCEMKSHLYKASHPLKPEIKPYNSEFVKSVTGQEGHIGLQVHPGKNWALPDGVVKYKDIVLKQI